MRSKKTWLTALYLALAMGLTAGVSGTALASEVYIIRDHSPSYYGGEYNRPNRGYWRERRLVTRQYVAPRRYHNPRRYNRPRYNTRRGGGGLFPALVGGVIGYHLND